MERHTTTIYTDGSIDQATGTAGAVLVTEGATNQWRLSDSASSTQAELVVIKGALQHLGTIKSPSVLIATDSRSALQQPWPLDNVDLLTNIRLLATQLQDTGTEVTLTSIPGHSNIRGNDLADKEAKTATTRPHTDIVLPPAWHRSREA